MIEPNQCDSSLGFMIFEETRFLWVPLCRIPENEKKSDYLVMKLRYYFMTN